jgi:hypothetical protein
MRPRTWSIVAVTLLPRLPSRQVPGPKVPDDLPHRPLAKLLARQAALPLTGVAACRFLLVTSRGIGRWIIPKGRHLLSTMFISSIPH